MRTSDVSDRPARGRSERRRPRGERWRRHHANTSRGRGRRARHGPSASAPEHALRSRRHARPARWRRRSAHHSPVLHPNSAGPLRALDRCSRYIVSGSVGPTYRARDDDHDRILHGLKLRAPGHQVGGRALGTVPGRGNRAEAKLGRTVRSLSRRNAGLSEIEARASRRSGRGRKFVARRTLTTTTRT